tara:strand:+ start:1450 stop:1635 length:186 start_codon:yes stop_codon:yes gene_type:complete
MNVERQGFFDFIQGLKGVDVKLKGKDIAYWELHQKGYTSNEIRTGKTPYVCLPEKDIDYKR